MSEKKQIEKVVPEIMEKTKKVKLRVLNDEGDLEFALLDVPMSDPRPAFVGSSLNEKDQKVHAGKGPTE